MNKTPPNHNAEDAKLAALLREYTPPAPRAALAERIILAAKQTPQAKAEPQKARFTLASLLGGNLWWVRAGALAGALLLGYLAGALSRADGAGGVGETQTASKAPPLYSVLIPEDEGL